MPKGKLKLRWRKHYNEYKAGPFTLWMGYSMWFSSLPSYGCDGGYETLDEAKRACEKLASRILGAMK